MRLFFALWPDASTQLEWERAVAPLQATLGGRRIPAANLHLTLAFLGEVRGDRMNELLCLGDDLDRSPVFLRLDRLEYWKKPGLACLRPTEVPLALERLAGQMQTGLSLAGFAFEHRHFKPHVTVSRDVPIATASLPVWPVLEWSAPVIALVRSRPGPAGADYAVLHEWPLG